MDRPPSEERTMTDPGYPRSYFYERLAGGLQQLAFKKLEQLEDESGESVQLFNRESPHPLGEIMAGHIGVRDMRWSQPRMEMRVIKVNIQDTLNRMKVCPCCGEELSAVDPMTRSCECGEFTITDVYSDGDVTLEFRLVAADEPNNVPLTIVLNQEEYGELT